MEAEMEPIDAAFQEFLRFKDQLVIDKDNLTTEADVRLKVIDPIFCQVLGWPHNEISTEEKSIDGFADYNLRVAGRSRIIVEAKRDSRTLGCANRPARRGFIIGGPVFNSQAAKEGINQAIRYCGAKSAELACVTNGSEWIIFRGNRLGDGLDVIDGMAFIFSSLDEVQEHFAFFFDLLSYESSGTHNFRPYFQEAEGRVIRSSSFRRPLNAIGSARLLPTGPLSADIDRIMTRFFDRLTGDNDPDLLVECFVETNESRAADGQLARISEDIIQRIRYLDTNESAALTQVIERATNNRQHEFVVIVGTKGAGKTTFVTRFFEKVLRPDIATLCIPMRVNLADSPGNGEQVSDWLDSSLLEAAEKSIFGEKPPSFDEILGSIFFDDYIRLSKGPWLKLYETDKDGFKIKFGEWAEDRRENKSHDYIARLIRFVSHSKKMLPIIVFDNADHFDIEFQERVYQYARSIYEKEVCLVILPITDRTSWQLSRQGALQSFEHEALFLPTPPTEQVIRKRIEFLSARVELEKIRPEDKYFVKNGISLTVSNLAAFTRSLQEVFLNTAETSRWIGSLSNQDIRRSLKLARAFTASPHLMIEDLLKAYYTGTSISIGRFKAAKALIRGNYRTYPAEQHEFVQNIFQLPDDTDTSPLLGLRILQMLQDSRGVDEEEGLVGIDQAVQYCQTMGFDARDVSVTLNTLLKSGLTQNYDPTVTDIASATQVSITPSGILHLQWGISNSEYISSMADVTSIVNQETFHSMRDSLHGPSAWRTKTKLFLEYLTQEDSHFFNPPEHISYQGQNNLLGEIQNTAINIAKGIRSFNEDPTST